MSSTASTHSTKDVQKTDSEYDDAERNYQPRSPTFLAIIAGVYLSIFLVALDRTIIAAAIPSITNEFGSIQDIGWYGSAYMLTCACLIPISGRVYQLYSTKRVYLLSITFFEAGSALCGAAPRSTVFILGRAIAGIGAAFLFSGGMMVILPLVPLRKRPVFNSLFGLAFGLSSVLGPIIGGAFTDHVTWRWCFYLNLPIGGFTLLAMLLFFNIESKPKEKFSLKDQFKRMDPLGIVCIVPSMVCLILALQWGGSTYSWSAPRIIGLLVTFAVLFVAFIVAEVLNPEVAIAPARVVLNRSVAGSMAMMFLLSGGMMSVVYFLTIWFQAAQGVSAMQSGINTIPLILSFVVIGITAAVVTQKTGYYNPAMLLSPILSSAGAGMLSTLTPTSSSAAWIGYQILYGCGVGSGFQTSNLPAQNVLPRADVPLGLALMFFMQQLGGSVFLSVSQSVFSNKLVDSLRGVSRLDPSIIINTGATDLRRIVPTAQLQVVINAYSYALTRVFVLTAVLSACIIICAGVVRWTKLKGKDEKKADAETADINSEDINQTSEKLKSHQ